MQKIDLAVWPRAELFRFFSAVSQPFYSVTFRVDVTNLHAYARAHGVSFYYALGYLVTDAVNAVENFRYTIRSGEVWLLDERMPSFTDLKPGSQQFHIVTLPKEGDLDSFCRITWGKYVPADGRETLGMCLEVNHRFVDGWHLGQFYQHLQQAIDALKI